MADLDLGALEAVARAATPGRWEVGEYHYQAEVRAWFDNEYNGNTKIATVNHGPADAAHIATFDPPTTLALIERVREAEREMHARELHHFEEEQARAKAEAERDAARESAHILGGLSHDMGGQAQDATARAERAEAELRVYDKQFTALKESSGKTDAAITRVRERHTPKNGESARYASDDWNQEREPTHWEPYTICNADGTSWPCSTIRALEGDKP